MKQIKEKFEKSDIAALPKVLFEGRIFVVLSEREADRAVDYLLRQPILGFDTETRPSFRRGQMHKVALLQVSTHDTAFLFRLNRIGLCDSVVRMLEDTKVVKVGLSLKDDMMQLQHRRHFQKGTFVELQDEVQQLGVQDMSLQKLYANLLGGRMCLPRRSNAMPPPTPGRASRYTKKYNACSGVAIINWLNNLIVLCTL